MKAHVLKDTPVKPFPRKKLSKNSRMKPGRPGDVNFIAAGKGDADNRVDDREAYGSNFDAIQWNSTKRGAA